MAKEKLTIHEKLVLIQSELKVPKGQLNKFGGYKFRSNEDILNAAKKVAKKYGCFIVQTDEMVEIGGRVYCKSETNINDGSGYINTMGFAREPLTQKGMSESQLTGTASSYARKYSANGLFALDETESDPDHDNKTVKQEPVKPFLGHNTDAFHKAKEFIAKGGTMAQIESKYKLTVQVKNALTNG